MGSLLLRIIGRGLARGVSRSIVARLCPPRDFRFLLEDLRTRPAAYGVDGTYQGFTAFLRPRRELDGFARWLAAESGQDAGLPWPELIRRICVVEHGAEPADDALSARMFTLLGEFLAVGLGGFSV